MSFCSLAKDLIDLNISSILSLRNSFVKKSDDSYVSEGDLLVQKLLVDLASEKLPKFSIISEELEIRADTDFNNVIVIDPIDGTENFVSGFKEWGTGISVYKDGRHHESIIMLPELNDYLISGQKISRFQSRIVGLSSSISTKDMLGINVNGREIRVIGCAMYNLLSAIKGSFYYFVNLKGVNCWDLLPGINLAIEHNISVFIDGMPYEGQFLRPSKKYNVLIGDGSNEFLA